jgi:hypothetical protein
LDPIFYPTEAGQALANLSLLFIALSWVRWTKATFSSRNVIFHQYKFLLVPYINTQHPPRVDFEWEDLVYTTLSISNGVITGVSALAIYGLTEEVARFHWIAVPNATSKGDRPNLKLVRVRNLELGRTTIKIGDLDVGSKHKPDAKKMLEYARKLHVKIDSYLMMVTI